MDKEKTAFCIGNDLWQFSVIAFGLCNAPDTFERSMEKVEEIYDVFGWHEAQERLRFQKHVHC